MFFSSLPAIPAEAAASFWLMAIFAQRNFFRYMLLKPFLLAHFPVAGAAACPAMYADAV